MDTERYDAGIYDIARAVAYVLAKAEGSNPEQWDYGTGVCYYNDTFEIHGFWQHEDDDTFYERHDDFSREGMTLFHHYESGFRFEWYKRIGRSSEVLSEVEPKMLPWYKIVVDCLESLHDDKAPDWKCRHKEEKK